MDLKERKTSCSVTVFGSVSESVAREQYSFEVGWQDSGVQKSNQHLRCLVLYEERQFSVLNLPWLKLLSVHEYMYICV